MNTTPDSADRDSQSRLSDFTPMQIALGALSILASVIWRWKGAIIVVSGITLALMQHEVLTQAFPKWYSAVFIGFMTLLYDLRSGRNKDPQPPA